MKGQCGAIKVLLEAHADPDLTNNVRRATPAPVDLQTGVGAIFLLYIQGGSTARTLAEEYGKKDAAAILVSEIGWKAWVGVSWSVHEIGCN
jgi:hypothetical protein